MLPVQRLCLLSVYANAVKPSKKKAVLDHVRRSLLGTQNAAEGSTENSMGPGAHTPAQTR